MGLSLTPIDIPPGLNSDDTTYASPPAWSDGNNVRFRLGRPQTIGGWESLTLSTLPGVCRTVLGWTDNANTLNIAFGQHNKLHVWVGGALYDITPTLGLPAHTLGASPFATVNTSPTVTVTDSNHGLSTGASVIISGAVDTNGILAANLNGTRTVTVADANTYTFTAGSNATSTATGGGSAVVITPQVAFAGGAIDGAGSAGYGTGAYGGGAYGAPSTTDYFALTWSLSPWGQKLIASPRNQTIHLWSNATGTPAAPVVNAPRQVTYALVSPQRQVFALGCSQEVGGAFNPLCIRHSAIGDETNWSSTVDSSTTAREYVLPAGGRIVGGRVAGKYLLIWTNHALWLGTYVGQIQQVWSFDKVGDKCGLIGPNAAVVVGSTAYWMSPDRQFHSYTLGGAVSSVACPIRSDIAGNIAASQADKIVASSIAEYNEVRWDYPDARDGYENSRYVALAVDGPDAGAWYRGQMARTSMVDAGPSQYPIGTTYAGNCYWHEKGNAADGGALSWSITSADLLLDPNFAMLARKYFADFGRDQLGAVYLTITTRMAPEDRSPRTFGPYTIPAGQQEVDLMAEGRFFNITFSGSSAPCYARLGRILVDAKQRGRR